MGTVVEMLALSSPRADFYVPLRYPARACPNKGADRIGYADFTGTLNSPSAFGI